MDIEANQQPKQERPRNRWTPSLDQVLADLVVKQIHLGNRHNNVFDRKSWNSIRDEFNEQTELNYNINQLRKHLEVLRQRYDKLKSSRVQNDFVLEDTGCMLGFDLWEDLGVQPRSKPVKVKDSPIYEQLCTIFDDDTTEGKYAQSSHFEGLEESTENPITSPAEETVRSENLSTPNVAEARTNMAERKRKREPDSKTSSSSSQINPAALETIAGALSDMVTAFKSRTADPETEDDSFSITNCINALDEIENVDEGLYFAAVDLFENPGLRETFMSLRGNRLRLAWLQGKCRNLSLSGSRLG